MTFTSDKAIYLQMADRLCDEIIAGQYLEDSRIPSVREYAMLLQVNTNTAMKAYDQLSRDEIIYNKRGLGYFVSPGARRNILARRKREFMEQRLPELFRHMRLLGISIDDIRKAWEDCEVSHAS
jgi:DNA-binding transcriptional regulator YhcF (GntR family)